MTKHFVGSNGKYVGGFDDATQESDIGATVVPTSPTGANDVWNGSVWVASLEVKPPTLDERIDSLKSALIKKGVIAESDIAAEAKDERTG